MDGGATGGLLRQQKWSPSWLPARNGNFLFEMKNNT